MKVVLLDYNASILYKQEKRSDFVCLEWRGFWLVGELQSLNWLSTTASVLNQGARRMFIPPSCLSDRTKSGVRLPTPRHASESIKFWMIAISP